MVKESNVHFYDLRFFGFTRAICFFALCFLTFISIAYSFMPIEKSKLHSLQGEQEGMRDPRSPTSPAFPLLQVNPNAPDLR